MILCTCPICNESMEMPEQLRGKTLNCPNCGEPVKVNGINQTLTPDSGTIHTDPPVYSSRGWPVICMLLVAMLVIIWHSTSKHNWEKDNSDTIISLCRQTDNMLQERDYAGGISKYIELEDMLANREISSPILNQEIDKVRNQFEIIARLIHNDTQEIGYYTNLFEQYRQDRTQRALEALTEKVSKVY
ncbi:MAG: hypothetical protein JW745_05895 [Sedimentisphaerales bacterium]|nr:hypothetical protein [Sedimentisphaerales bacterium]MBN2841987.1 hypothetical protein [Sedimentisphaerales bacterium]